MYVLTADGRDGGLAIGRLRLSTYRWLLILAWAGLPQESRGSGGSRLFCATGAQAQSGASTARPPGAAARGSAPGGQAPAAPGGGPAVALGRSPPAELPALPAQVPCGRRARDNRNGAGLPVPCPNWYMPPQTATQAHHAADGTERAQSPLMQNIRTCSRQVFKVRSRWSAGGRCGATRLGRPHRRLDNSLRRRCGRGPRPRCRAAARAGLGGG